MLPVKKIILLVIAITICTAASAQVDSAARRLQTFARVSEATPVGVASNFPDSVTIVGASYYKAGRFKQFLFGKNYRREWAQPVRVPIFDIGKEAGGLKPTQLGGGKQSHSLRLEGLGGKEYVLRSIEKYPDSTLPIELRQTIAKDIVKDGISASYPYSGLSVPPLAEAAGIPHASPRLVYVPDDPRLGIFQKDIANAAYLFEEREPGESNKTYNTDKVYEKLKDDNDNSVDQQAVLKARLLDMFIMDFDRHEDQWRWGAIDTGKTKSFFPIPRDRDQAFFINNGFVPRRASAPWLVPQLQGFRARARNINLFNFAARNFDRSFLNGLSAKDWKKAAEELVSQMTDEVIERALHQQPSAIYQYSGLTIINTLKERRKYLVQEALQYYRFLSQVVTVAGSDKRELFDITADEDSSVTLGVYKITKEGETGKKIFERRFLPGETKEIRLFGMGGDDKFSLHGNGRMAIKIREIGGTGNDSFENALAAPGSSRPIVYDLASEQNKFTGTARMKVSADSNNLDRKGFKYDLFHPSTTVGYNADDGVFLGESIQYITQGYGKQPYKMLQQVSANHALATSAWNFGYKLEAIDAIGKADLVFDASMKAPKNTINFFGFGNETQYVKGKDGGIRYYRARFDVADLALMARMKFGSFTTVSIGPAFQHFHINSEDNTGRFIDDPKLAGLDSSTLYSAKNFAGIVLNARFDSRNNLILPTSGINWQTSFRASKGLGDASKNISQLNSDISIFFSFKNADWLVLAQRIGGGINFGHYEFFQSQYLSSTENLRGFRKYRFAGDKLFFSNTELRIKIVDFTTYLFPGSLGVLGFYDAGRVWVKNESSNVWHSGYGGGIWVAPVKRFVITATYAASEEGNMPIVSFGFQF